MLSSLMSNLCLVLLFFTHVRNQVTDERYFLFSRNSPARVSVPILFPPLCLSQAIPKQVLVLTIYSRQEFISG